GGQGAAGLLADLAHAHMAEIEPALGLGHQHPGPAQLDHGPPGFGTIAEGIALVAQCSQLGHGSVRGEEFPRRILEHALFFVQYQRHDSPRHSLPKPRMRLAMMFNWISEVPPSMELPLVRSHWLAIMP